MTVADDRLGVRPALKRLGRPIPLRRQVHARRRFPPPLGSNAWLARITKVIPFIGESRGRLSANDVESQLQSVIAQHAAADWEFCQLSDVNIEVQPGCIAGLFGATVHYARFDQIIFRRTRRT